MKIILVAFVGCLLLLALYSAYGIYVAEQQFPPIGDFVEVRDHRMHYIEEGVCFGAAGYV